MATTTRLSVLVLQPVESFLHTRVPPIRALRSVRLVCKFFDREDCCLFALYGDCIDLIRIQNSLGEDWDLVAATDGCWMLRQRRDLPVRIFSPEEIANVVMDLLGIDYLLLD